MEVLYTTSKLDCELFKGKKKKKHKQNYNFHHCWLVPNKNFLSVSVKKKCSHYFHTHQKKKRKKKTPSQLQEIPRVRPTEGPIVMLRGRFQRSSLLFSAWLLVFATKVSFAFWNYFLNSFNPKKNKRKNCFLFLA